jgi:hypothetical protein
MARCSLGHLILFFVDLTVARIQDPFLTLGLLKLAVDLKELVLLVGNDKFYLILLISNLFEQFLVKFVHVLKFFFGRDYLALQVPLDFVANWVLYSVIIYIQVGTGFEMLF